MNRSDKPKWYLAHPFSSRKKVRAWELKIEEKFGIELVNPFYDVPRPDIEVADKEGDNRYIADPVAIVERDLAILRKTDGVVAIVDGSLSYGTIMEIVYSSLFIKPVFIIVTNGHIGHYWLQYHGERLFASYREFEKWLKKLMKELK